LIFSRGGGGHWRISEAENSVPFLQHSAKNSGNGLCVGLFFIA